ncbi:MAG: radical SAM family heme chaperone HemW [Acidiferrobacterales bacterium]
MFSFSALPPLSLYIHLPWCVSKCPYCDFNSHGLDTGTSKTGGVPENRYVDALIADLEQDLPRVWGRAIRSIFIGGGTPSLFSPDTIDRLLREIRARLPVLPGAEVTLEANPGTVDIQHFRGYRAAGINRLSLGIQSFDAASLRLLGRIHGPDEARNAAQSALAGGFDNFNLDLMYALPQQSVESALRDLNTALSMRPAHLSIYQLTIEPNTLFHAKPPQLPDEDTVAEMQDAIQARVADAGYHHYEVSAYALPGRECRHNLNYWRFGDYLGIGAGAHAKITDATGITRLWKVKQPEDYMLKSATPEVVGGEHRLLRDEAGFEFMLNALRLQDGISSEIFTERTGLPLAVVESALRIAEEKGLLRRDPGSICPTGLGRRFLNDLIALFLPCAS